ncbi:MAG TPA: fatty acid desaturase [Hyphomicrobium sp.]|mgnify:CR=1 FL=1|nr:fatty acid desaturase [Hyphomicrobium sp.]
MKSAALEHDARVGPPAERRGAQTGLGGEQLLRLKARDNVTNCRHLGRVWLIIAATYAAVIWLQGFLAAYGVSLWWGTPAWLLAIFVIGASQHQLGGAIHEGTHSLLFANKRLNELGSDWLAAFPIYTSTYQYRVHHLAHHQFVNDPVRDPDISQLKDSDHWLDFPIEHIDILRKLAKQLWLPNLFRFTLVRARYSALGGESNPYLDKSLAQNKWPVRAGIYFAVAVPFIVNYLIVFQGAAWAWGWLAASYAFVMAYYARLPDREFPQSRLRPVIAHRATAMSRMTFLFVLYAALTAHDAGTGATWAWDQFGRFWALPLFTSFPLFMMMRQWVQHGNADRGRYTNTRVFLAGPIIRYAVLPWGMDYHLPHHIVASVPHYRLKELHDALMQDPEYKEKALLVEGYFGEGDPSAGRPTILSVLGPGYAPRAKTEAFVDDATLEYVEVDDAAAIAREARRSADQGGSS